MPISIGNMKVAYGMFFTALMMIYCHDILANTASSEFNVTWSRTHPVVVSVGDDAYQTYLTLECDHGMGMTVAGSLKNIISFNNICSSAISLIEYAVMDNLGYGQINTIDTWVNSVTLDLLNQYLINSTSLECLTQNGYIIVKANNNENFLVIDLETGVIRDINTINGYYGAYCFHDQLTGESYSLGKELNQEKKQFNWRKAAHWGCIGLIVAGELLMVVACPPAGATALYYTGLALVVGGTVGGGYLADTYGDWWI